MNFRNFLKFNKQENVIKNPPFTFGDKELDSKIPKEDIRRILDIGSYGISAKKDEIYTEKVIKNIKDNLEKFLQDVENQKKRDGEGYGKNPKDGEYGSGVNGIDRTEEEDDEY
jgi:protein associated with RNAse G/E